MAEAKIGIVLDGLRGEEAIADLCRRKDIAQRVLCRDEKMPVAGDIVVIDLDGNGAHIDYSAASNINISPDS